MICETPDIGGWPCKRKAVWLVMVGTRRADAQLSCPQHLNKTCRTQLDNERSLVERTVTLTIEVA